MNTEIQIIENTFQKGLNVDIDERFQEPGTYRKAVNLTISAENGYYAIKTIAGSKKLNELLPAGNISTTTPPNVLGAFECNTLYKAGVYGPSEEINPSIAIFIYSDYNGSISSRIFMYDIRRNVTHQLFGKTITDNALNFPAQGTVDAVIFGENGYSNIYFVDGQNPGRKLPCIVDNPYTLSIRDISLRPYAPIDPLFYQTVSESGGNLLSGTYQFAYRYVKSTTSKHTTWSLLTNPIPIYPPNFTNSIDKEDIYGGVPGEPTTKAVVLSIGVTPANGGFYDSVQLAVVKNIDGDKNVSQIAWITPAKKSWYNNPNNISYVGNDKEMQTDISDIVIEDAAIKSIGTISTKDNVMVGGNVRYSDLSGVNPTFQSATTIKEKLGNLGYINFTTGGISSNPPDAAKGIYKNPLNCANKKGYFRGETYAFGITYMDEYGNWSEPTRLDFSTFQNNAGGSYGLPGCVDWKYPKRSDNGFAIMDKVDAPVFGNPPNYDAVAVGLRLTGITNHPTWAKAVAIVRAKRIKNILYQTPVVPAIQAMPTVNYSGAGTIAYPTDPSLTTDGSFMPKKHATGSAQDILRSSLFVILAKDNATYKSASLAKVFLLYPPEYMYQFNSQSYEKLKIYNGARLVIADAVSYFVSALYEGANSSNGSDYNGRHGFAFRADSSEQYYYLNGTTKPPLKFENNNEIFATMKPLDITPILDSFITMPLKRGVANKEINRVMDGNSISLWNFGYPMVAQKCLSVIIEKNAYDLTMLSARANAVGVGVWSNYHFGIDNTTLYNPGAGSFKGNSITDNTVNVNDYAVACNYICNYEIGINEFRYGDKDSQLEYIFTGAYSAITSPSQMVNLDVWGGDCFIGKHYIKTGNNALGIFPGISVPGSNGEADNNQVKAYPEFAEVLGCYIESEVNCDLAIPNLVYPVAKGSVSNFTTENRYDYNFGYSVQNEAKVFVSLDTSIAKKNIFKARLIISDQKIYQSNIEGFDRFKATSFYDMDESFGSITKLDINQDGDMICFQERGISNLYLGKNVIEDLSGAQLTVASKSIISKPQYITTTNGCQSIRTIAKTNQGFIFADLKKREIVMLSSSGITPISNKGMYSYFQQKLNYEQALPGNILQGVYDFNNDEYILQQHSYYDLNLATNVVTHKPQFAVVFSEKADNGQGGWTSEISLPDEARMTKMLFADKKMYMIGMSQESPYGLVIEEMYSGLPGRILGITNPTSFDIIINNTDGFTKSYDVICFDATNQMTSVVLKAPKEGGWVTTDPQPLNFKSRQDLYELQILRDNLNMAQRIRGKYAVMSIIIDNLNEIPVSLNKIYTRFRQIRSI